MKWPELQAEVEFLPAPDAPRKAAASIRRRLVRRLRGRGALVAGALLLALFYLAAVFAESLAPYDYRSASGAEPNAPPTRIHFVDDQGRWHARPFIYRRRSVDLLQQRYEEIPDRAFPIEFFSRGEPYEFLWLFPTTRRLFGLMVGPRVGPIDGPGGVGDTPRLNLLGTDSVGRDRFSRLLIAARFSLLVGPLGALLASAFGVLIGVLAGAAGRWADVILMRAADATMALPTLVIILAARAAFPPELPYFRAFGLLVFIFVLLGWAEVARLARGLTRDLRHQEYVLAARSLGGSPARVIFRHILPNAAGPLVTQTLLLIPTFLLAETALSYLGAGLQEPNPSWGNMLTALGDNHQLLRGHALTTLTPALAIMLYVLGVRLLSHGLKNLHDELPSY
jgi:peptide/nickel transport system permease protein